MEMGTTAKRFELPKYVTQAEVYRSGGQMFYVVIRLEDSKRVFYSWNYQEVLDKAKDLNSGKSFNVI